jgi:hypothetical protein
MPVSTEMSSRFLRIHLNGNLFSTRSLAMGLYVTILSRICVTIDGVWICEWTYWPQITIVHDNTFHPTMSSLAILWQRLLTVETLQLHKPTSLISGEYPAAQFFSSQPPVQNCLLNLSLSQSQSQSQSQSYFMADSLPPISLPWRQASWDSRTDFFFNWTLAVIVLL